MRNVTASLPKFTETFIDDGYGNINSMIQTIVNASYKFTIILDHSPLMSAGVGFETAFAQGYMKANIKCA